MALTKSSLLQTNAIVIAGILILMTIQSTTSISPRDMALEGLVMQKEMKNFQELQDSFRDMFQEKNWELDEKTSDFLLDQMYQDMLEMNRYIAKSETYFELEWWEKLLYSPSFPATLIIIPFAASALIELLHWKKTKSDEPSTPGLLAIYGGFGIILAVFVGNFIIPTF